MVNLDKATSIGKWAFDGCTGITGVRTSSVCTYLGQWAFRGCTGIDEAVIDGTGLNLSNSRGLFEGCVSLRSLELGEGVVALPQTKYGDNFYCALYPLCTNLESVVVGTGIHSIPEAFGRCGPQQRLESVEFKGDVASVGAYAFAWVSVTNIDIRLLDGCTIGYSSFDGCPGATFDNIDFSKVISIDNAAFRSCLNLSGILDLPHIVSIPSEAFSGCSGITEVRFNQNVSSIAWHTFQDCTAANKFVFSGAPPSVGSSAFGNVKNGAIGTYTAAHAAEWEAVIDDRGYWNGLKMKPSYYTVIYDANNGTGARTTATVEWGEPTPVGDGTFTWEAHYFMGWAFENVGGSTLGSDDFIPEPQDGNIVTLYAVWEEIFSAPSNLQATEYHNQHPQGVKLTWSPVAGAPGYVILRKIVGENDFYPVGATPDTEYINKVATIPNVKDFKAQYVVAVADWQGNDPNTIVYLSPQSNPEWGSWRENPPPTVEHLPPRVIGLVKSNANPMLSGVKGANVYTIEFNDDYDTSGYVFKQAKITGVGLRNGKRYDFTSSTRSVTVDIPAGEHGPWSFEGRAVFTETASGKDYTTPIFNEGLDNVRVCFRRIGRDGVKVNGTKVWGNKEAPNWFKYWKRDGALSLLDEEEIYYDSLPWWSITSHFSLQEAGATTSPFTGTIYLRDRVLTDVYGSYIMNNGQQVELHTSDASSLLKCAEVLKHELGHRELWKLRGEMSGLVYWRFSGQDKDKDGLPDYIENTCSFLPFRDDNCDTFDFMGRFSGVYSKENSDEEVYVRYLATYDHNKAFFDSAMNEDNDFSWESSDTTTKKRRTKLSVTPSLSNMTPSEVLLSGSLDDKNFFCDEHFIAYDNLIKINGVNSLVPLVLNSDSFDGLRIDISCSASTSMPCVVVATIVAENDEPVAWASRTGYVDEGENDVTLKIDGSVLRESGKNGYTVASVAVFDMRSIELMYPIAYAAVNYASSIRYKWSDFRTDNVTIQSLTLSEGDGCVNVSAQIVVPSEDGVYDLSTFLCDAGTSDYVAEASQTNIVLHVGTNAVSLAFATSDIQMNAVSNAFAISKFTVEKDGEIVAAYNGDATLNVTDETILNPTNAVLAFDEATVTNELVASGNGVLYSGVNFAFDVMNSHTNAVDYTLTAYLNSTNSLTVDMVTFDLSVTSGVNRIVIPFRGAKIGGSGIDGPYVLSSVRLESKDAAIASQTLRMDSKTADCTASDFQGDIIARLVGISRKSNRDDSIVASITFETAGAVSGIVNASLVDAENKVIMFGCTGFAADCVGSKNVEICFAVSNITESAYTMPLRIAYISIVPSDKLLPSLADDTLELVITELDYLEPVAPPSFSPATKTVFFRNGQPVVISCATPDAEIRYTLDGSEPTAGSALYEGSLVVSNSVTVKAKAFVEGLSPSETVQAEYVRAAIVGANLVQNTSPGQGEPQTLSIPAPGTYQLSFDWTQGGDIELRLLKDGGVRTLAAISADTAGTTNILFDVAAAGDYELTVFDMLSGSLQPAEVSELSIAIPGTPENRSRYWIYETERTYGSTGEWTGSEGFKGGKIPIRGTSKFTPYTPSSGSNVTVTTTVEFEMAGHVDVADYPDDIMVLAMGLDETGDNVFKVMTIEQGVKVFKNVHAEGMGSPETGTPYTFKIATDTSNRTYSVTLISNEGEKPLTDGTSGVFAFCRSSAPEIKAVGYSGYGELVSLLGSCGTATSVFAEGDTLRISGGTVVMNLTDGQARWLNSMGAYDAIKAKAGGMEMEDFMVAYLLNLDLTKDGARLVSFNVIDIDVTETEVLIKVRLNRAGTMQKGKDGGGMADAPINGVLKLYGGNSPLDKNLINATKVTDADFGDGDTASFSYPRSGGVKFFRPAIEVPAK